MTKLGHACVISLTRTPERLEKFRERFATVSQIFPQPTEVKAVDGHKLPKPLWWTCGPGTWGCHESHRFAIQCAMESNLPSILIMEDDCEWTVDAAARIPGLLERLPDDWDVFMLGSQPNPWASAETVAEGIQKCRGFERTHCYALSAKGMRSFYQQLCHPFNEPCDFTMGHWQGLAGINAYRADPVVAVQGAAFSTLEDRYLGSRAWDKATLRKRDIFATPLISLKCPADVARRLMDDGLICTGYPKDPRGYDYVGGIDEMAAEQILALCTNELAGNRIYPGALYVLELARHYEKAVACLWHPRKFVPCDWAVQVEADDYDTAKRLIEAAADGWAANNPSDANSKLQPVLQSGTDGHERASQPL